MVWALVAPIPLMSNLSEGFISTSASKPRKQVFRFGGVACYLAGPRCIVGEKLNDFSD